MKFYVPVLLALILGGCSFGQWGKDLGGGLTQGAAEHVDSLGSKFVGGAVDTLTAAATQERLNLLIERLGNSLARQAAQTRDTLLGEYSVRLIARLRQDLLGAGTKADLGAIRDEVIGIRTRQMIGGLRDELLGDQTIMRASSLRDNLLGQSTQIAVQAIVDSAMISLVRRYNKDLAPELQSQFTFLQRNATQLLILIAVLAVGVIAFVWWQKTKYRRLLALLANQIHNIPDKNSYDQLTRGVQLKAQESGTEPLLRKVLADQGLLGSAAWVTREAR
jgi:hypothetical protein